MPIPTEDVTRARTTAHNITSKVWDFWPREVVATATITQSTFGYPLGDLTVGSTSAGWSDIQTGMLYEVTDGNGDLVTTGVVRKAPTSTILYIDGKSLGDPGRAYNIAGALATGQTVTVYSFRPLWSLVSRIVNRTFYKKFDLAYTDEGSNGGPIVNIGSWRYALVDTDDDEATFTFSTNASGGGVNATVALFGKSITTTAWTLPAEATVTAGATDEEEVTFTLPPGFYTVSCTVTDSGTVSTTALRPVWVRTRYGSTPSALDGYAVENTSDRQTLKGREVTLTIHADPRGTVPDILPGGAFVYFEESTFGGQALTDGVMTDLYVGFITSENQTGTLRDRSLTVNLRSPFQILEEIPMVPQAILEKTTPANWTEIKDGYGDVNYLVWYLLQHHAPSMLQLFDFNRLVAVTALRKRSYAFAGASVAQQLEEVAALICRSNIGSASDGSLFFLPEPRLQDNTFRNAMDTRMTIETQDVGQESIEIDARYRAQTGKLIIYAFALSGSTPVPLASVAPGKHQGQATGRTTGENILIANQTALNQTSGHLLALENAETESVSFTMNRNLDFFDPARQFNAWWAISIGARYRFRNTTFSERMLVTEVQRIWEQTPAGDYIKRVQPTFAIETFGQPGETMPVNTGGAAGSTYQITYPQPELYQRGNSTFAIAFDDNGGIGRTAVLSSASAWASIKGTMTGTVNDVAFDWFSERPQNGWLSGALGAWACSISGSTFYIYYTSNILGDAVAWTLQDSFTMNDATADTNGRIVSDRATDGFVVAGWRDGKGVVAVSTTDGGANWTDTRIAGDVGTDAGSNDDAPFGLDVSGGATIVSGLTSTTSYQLYRRLTTGGSFEVVPSSPSATSPNPLAFYASDGGVYTATSGGGGGTFEDQWMDSIGFDSRPGGDPDADWPYSSIITVDRTLTGSYSHPSGLTFQLSGDGSILSLDIVFADVATIGGFAPVGEGGAGNIGFQTTLVMPQPYLSDNFATEVIAIYDAADAYIDGFTVTHYYDGGVTNDKTSTIDVKTAQWETTPLTGVKRVNMTAETNLTFGALNYLLISDAFINLVEMVVNTKALYRVVNYNSGGPTWSDITPASDIPLHREGFSPDGVTPTTLRALTSSTADSTTLYTQSVNSGTAWNTVQPTISYQAIKQIGNEVLLWGTGGIGRSSDGGSLITSVTGDYTSSIGSFGKILGVRAVL